MRRPLLVVMALALATSLAVPASASPPPPPAPWVGVAATLLSKLAGADPAAEAALFAEDVTAAGNGAVVARGKTAWLAFRGEHYSPGRQVTIAISEANAATQPPGGQVLIYEKYDRFEKTSDKPFGDDRLNTRATLYQFGADHLIHAVLILDCPGFPFVPR